MELITRKTLLAKVPLADRTIYNMEKAGKFPKRIALTPRKVVWKRDEVDAWIEARIAAGASATRPGEKTQLQ